MAWSMGGFSHLVSVHRCFSRSCIYWNCTYICSSKHVSYNRHSTLLSLPDLSQNRLHGGSSVLPFAGGTQLSSFLHQPMHVIFVMAA
ncbi:hypothetical protein BZA05DRAFT_409865 [Tricharina praecox]|uniref:uncharacterized protein n=1 Tax=Tricharina praecox TaxID=43433 RepID=UPI002220203D|nr:uncharacterized protein BZA05DRAFT_409865 [Tricharina praecox]KAI5844087.1 hypothetical protein BZA05DRAFT_409865 [Tricharina praecox]